MTDSGIDRELDSGASFFKQLDGLLLVRKANHIVPVSVKGPDREVGKCLLERFLVRDPVTMAADWCCRGEVARVAANNLVSSKSSHAQAGDIDPVGIDPPEALLLEIYDVFYLVDGALGMPPEGLGAFPVLAAIIGALWCNHDERKMLSFRDQLRRAVDQDAIKVVAPFSHSVKEDDNGELLLAGCVFSGQVEPVGDEIVLLGRDLNHLSCFWRGGKGPQLGQENRGQGNGSVDYLRHQATRFWAKLAPSSLG